MASVEATGAVFCESLVELFANSAEEANEDTIQAIMLSVLPRPIPSPSIPPRVSSGFGLIDPVMMCLYLA